MSINTIPGHFLVSSSSDRYGTAPRTIQKFLENSQHEPFCTYLQSIWNDNALHYNKADSTHSQLIAPTQDSMKVIAEHYRKKYGIEIFFAKEDEIDSCIKNLEDLSETPRHVGLIVCYKADSMPTHVLPILCYFTGKEPSKSQFLMLNSQGLAYSPNLNPPYFFSGLAFTVFKNAIKDRQIHCSTSPMQSDNSSCRTIALTLLRNVLLSLKDKDIVFSDLLGPGQFHSQLPVEWIYDNQIITPLEKAEIAKGQHLVIRQLYSNKVEKRMNPTTIKERREKNSEELIQTFRIKIPSTSPQFTHLPKEVQVQQDDEFTEYTITLTSTVNNTIYHKAFKNSLKLK